MKVEIDLPNEGPIVDGFVRLPDGSGVLPPFYAKIICSQCGKTPECIPDICGCGRVTLRGEPRISFLGIQAP